MARSEARLQFGLWDGLEAVSAPAKLLYVVILTDPTFNHAGVGRLSIALWAQNAGISEQQTVDALAELEREPQVVVDRRTQEVLIRTLIRNDGVASQPYVLKGALKEALQTRSPVVRRALARELRKLPPKQPDGVGKNGRQVVYPDPHAVADQLDPPPPGAHENPPERVSSGSPAEPTGKGFETLRGGGRGGGSGSTPVATQVESKEQRPSRAREAHQEPPLLETAPPPSPTAAHADLAGKAVQASVPNDTPRDVRRDLMTMAANLLADGTTPDVLTAALAKWRAKSGIGPRVLPHLVTDVLREREAAAKPRTQPKSTTRDRQQDCFDRSALYAEAEANGITDTAGQFAYVAARQQGADPGAASLGNVIELPPGRTA